MRKVKSLFPFYRWRFIEIALLGKVSEQKQVSNSKRFWLQKQSSFWWLPLSSSLKGQQWHWIWVAKQVFLVLVWYGGPSITLQSLCCVGDYLLLWICSLFWSHFCLYAFLICRSEIPPVFLAVEWLVSALCL